MLPRYWFEIATLASLWFVANKTPTNVPDSNEKPGQVPARNKKLGDVPNIGLDRALKITLRRSNPDERRFLSSECRKRVAGPGEHPIPPSMPGLGSGLP